MSWNFQKHAWVPKKPEHSRKICYQQLASVVPVSCLPNTLSISYFTINAIAPGTRNAKGQRSLASVQVLVNVCPHLANSRSRVRQHILRGPALHTLVYEQRSISCCKHLACKICS